MRRTKLFVSSAISAALFMILVAPHANAAEACLNLGVLAHCK